MPSAPRSSSLRASQQTPQHWSAEAQKRLVRRCVQDRCRRAPEGCHLLPGGENVRGSSSGRTQCPGVVGRSRSFFSESIPGRVQSTAAWAAGVLNKESPQRPGELQVLAGTGTHALHGTSGQPAIDRPQVQNLARLLEAEREWGWSYTARKAQPSANAPARRGGRTRTHRVAEHGTRDRRGGALAPQPKGSLTHAAGSASHRPPSSWQPARRVITACAGLLIPLRGRASVGDSAVTVLGVVVSCFPPGVQVLTAFVRRRLPPNAQCPRGYAAWQRWWSGFCVRQWGRARRPHWTGRLSCPAHRGARPPRRAPRRAPRGGQRITQRGRMTCSDTTRRR